MAFWKQLVVSLLVIVVAAGLWARFFPGAPDTLQRWGLDWLPVAATAPAADAPARQRGPGGGGGRMQPIVVAEPVNTATINDRLSAIGTGRAVNSVVVNPFASGRLTRILVTSGTAVSAGDEIARLDSDAEEIAVDRARIALDDARARLERVSALRSSNTVTAVQLTEAELAVRNAELAVRDAELALDRRSIAAPISGVVGIISVSAGSNVNNQTEIATIDDRSEILIDFWVPERLAGMLSVGDALEASSVARPGEVFEGAVSAMDNRIDAQSRTLRVQARVANANDTLRAGMSFRVSMRFPGDSYPTVNPLAIQWGTEGAYIWVVRDGIAHRTPVRVIQRNTDSVLVDAPLEPGMMVVTEGIHAVREGAPVEIVTQTEGAAVSEADQRRRAAPSGT